jgi:hypothetical protein
MIKIFTTNKDGKIELTKEELKNLLDDSYWEGYRANNLTYVYKTPNWSPYTWTITGANTTVTSHTSSNDTSNTVSANEVR